MSSKWIAALSVHRYLRRLQARRRMRRGLEPTQLPGENPEPKEGGDLPMFKNWKTTLVGALAGTIGGTAQGWTTPDGSINWMSVALAIAMAFLGALAKDHNATGGSVPMTPEAAKRTGL